MMSKEPQPNRTAEKSRFSMMAVTAIHQRRANAVARVGAMTARFRKAERKWVVWMGDLRSVKESEFVLKDV